jgi:uncharacterized protein (TIGR02246 family)
VTDTGFPTRSPLHAFPLGTLANCIGAMGTAAYALVSEWWHRYRSRLELASDAWTKSFAASDVDAIVKLYSDDALFMGTGSKDVVMQRKAIRRYFEDALLTRRPRAAPISSSHVMVLSDSAVLITGLNPSTGVLEGKPFSNPERVTFVIAKRGPEWKIVHFHRSTMPR